MENVTIKLNRDKGKLEAKEFDFTKGGIVDGIHYPALRPLDQSLKYASQGSRCEFVVYEPGNGTRYEMFLGRRGPMMPDPRLGEMDEYFPRNFIAIVNFGRPRCMSFPTVRRFGLANIDFICEKMDVQAGDAYALIPLINDFLERHRNE